MAFNHKNSPKAKNEISMKLMSKYVNTIKLKLGLESGRPTGLKATKRQQLHINYHLQKN